MDPFNRHYLPEFDQYGGINDAQYPPLGFDYGNGATGYEYGTGATDFGTQAIDPTLDVPLAPKPPPLQIQPELDANGNWYYPVPDQENRELRIQGEAFRAGAAFCPGVSLPMSAIRNQELRRKILQPKSRQIPRNSSRESPRPSVKKVPRGRTGGKTSLETACTCPISTVKIPRPMNAFMLFRTAHQVQLLKATREQPRGVDKNGNQKTQQAAVSSLAAKWWRVAKEKGEQQEWFHRAEIKKARHAELYPDYKYDMHKKYKKNWGDKTCVCGAFQANEAKKQRKQALHAGVEDADTDNFEFGDLDEGEDFENEAYLPRGQKRPKRASSRFSFMEPPPERRKASKTNSQNPGYTTTVDHTAVFPQESYTYGNPSMIDPQLTQSTRPRSRGRSAADIYAGVGFNPDDLNDEELFDGLEANGEDYRHLFVPYQTDAAYDGQIQGENVRMRGASFDSLFDMEEHSNAQRHRRSSRSGSKRSSPTNLNGGRRSSRRSQGSS